MQYTIKDNQLTVTDTPRIPGVITAHGKAFSNANGGRVLRTDRGRIRIELAKQDAEQTLDIPEDVDQTKLERCMDDLLVFSGDMTADERDEKWEIGDYAPEPSG